MVCMRREDQDGIFGKHDDLEKLVNEVKQYSRGITRKNLQEELGFSKDKFDKILTQADALGMVIVEDAIQGKGGKVHYTDHRELHFELSKMSQEEIQEELSKAVEELTEESDEIRINIQGVEE